MSRQEALLAGRALAAAGMVDACRIHRGTGGQTFNPDTGQYESAGATVYEGPCEVRSTQSQASTPEAGGVVFNVTGTQVKVPAGTDARDGDIVVMLSSEYSPALVGVELRVEGFIPDTWDTAYRLPVKVNT